MNVWVSQDVPLLDLCKALQEAGLQLTISSGIPAIEKLREVREDDTPPNGIYDESGLLMGILDDGK